MNKHVNESQNDSETVMRISIVDLLIYKMCKSSSVSSVLVSLFQRVQGKLP